MNQPAILIWEGYFGSLYAVWKSGSTVIVATPNLSLIDMFPGRVWVCEDEN